MKKNIISLIVLALILFIPAVVFAEMVVEPNIPSTPVDSKDVEDGKVAKTYPIYLIVKENSDNKQITTTTFKFTFGKAIKTTPVCTGANGFEGRFEDNGGNTGTCTFTSAGAEGAVGNKVQVGTITVTVDKNSADEDCKIDYYAEGVSGTFNKGNPTTGASIPFGIIAGGLTLALGAYFVTSKRNALYKI